MSNIDQETIDLDNDGVISDMEMNTAQTKFQNRRRMAWLSMISMVIFTAILLSPFISNEKIEALDEVFSMFYLAMASIVGAYMGFTTWANKK
jgi:hypothetical protein